MPTHFSVSYFEQLIQLLIITHSQLAKTEEPQRNGEVRILLAEDNHVNQKLIMLLFRKMPYPVTVVSNGQEAVDEALNQSYSLIFMDVHMPEMDGLDAARLLKEKLGNGCPPIVALTASAMPEDRERLLQAGMDDYIAKPMDMNKLNEVIGRYVQT